MSRRSSNLKSEKSVLAAKVQPIEIAALIRGLGLQTRYLVLCRDQPLELAREASGWILSKQSSGGASSLWAD